MYDSTLPLIDLHRHLDGNVRLSTILELGQQFGLDLPANDLEGLRPHCQVIGREADLLGFLSKLDWGVKVLGDYDACRRIAYENVADLDAADIDYAELRFSPYYMGMTHGLDPAGVTEAVIDGVQRGLQDFPGVSAKLIGILSRTFGAETCQRELDGLLAHKQHLVAIDLAGDELGQPGANFAGHFKQVAQTDLQVTVHAGEADGPSAVWYALDHLGASRIGHGVRSIEDPKLMLALAERGIGIESCLTSNVQTSTVPSLAEHPLRHFLDQGILACINTDDPGVSAIELKHEYGPAAQEAGLTQQQVLQSQRNSLTIAFLSDFERDALVRRVGLRDAP